MAKRPVFFLLTLTLLFLAACASGPREFIVVDEREELGDVFTETTGGVDNSNGEDFLYQDLAALREFRHRMDINLTPAGEGLDRQQIEERLLDTYDLPDRSGNKTCLVPADVPPGNVYAYEIEWTQIRREGRIEEGPTPGVGNIYGTYEIVIDLQCQTVGVVVLQ